MSRLSGLLGYPQGPARILGRLEVYRRSGGEVWVAEVDGQVVGFLSFHTQPCFHAAEMLGRVTAMCVDRKRCGAGRAMIEVMEAAARKLGCSRVEVTSGEHRAQEAHLFYEAMGYQRTSVRFVKPLTRPR
ncbi:GNAT family N-acetyltransferase [Haloferula sargassicola]